MKFRCERDVLVDALGVAGRGIAGRGSAQPVLSGLKAELRGDELRLTGTNNDLTITIDVTVAGGEDGVIVLPARLTTDVVRALGAGAVSIVAADDEVQISSGRSEFSIKVMEARDFPLIGEPAGDAVTLDATELATALKQVVPAASSDDSRPILTGVLLAAEETGLRLVATDSYRLAVRDLPGTSLLEPGQSVLVPSQALNELVRILAGDEQQVVVHLGERDATFVVGRVRLTTRLIDGEFPNYRSLIPTSQPNRLTVGREALIEALRRVRLLARESTPVRLAMRDGGVELLAITQDVGQAHDELDAGFDGEELTVAFNPDYLLDGVEASPGDEVALETIDALKPALVRPTDGASYLYLLMPVRVT